MVYKSVFKNTVLLFLLLMLSCGSSVKVLKTEPTIEPVVESTLLTGAQRHDFYLPMLYGKRVGVVTNQTGIISNQLHLIDFLMNQSVAIKKIYAPEHGFRGTADAGEHIVDGKDAQTGLPVISLYGNNKKPKPEQLADIDIIIFDLQDVGARFYTYISTLHYIMEACAENKIPLLILDRPNPNGAIVDGPTLEKEYTSFVGMHQIPLLHGMTIGEYAQMINGEKWLKDGVQCNLKVIPCANYNRNMAYSLPIKPSPNLPNDQSINLYEGTNVSVGRGTEKQFQIYGSPYLPKGGFKFTPQPNFGAKDPLYKGQICYGEDLSKISKVEALELKWLIKAYESTTDKSKFFNPFFTKLLGTKAVQQQIEAGFSESKIKKTWKPGIEAFLKMRKQYLIY